MKESHSRNISKFLARLLKDRLLPVTLMKKIDFDELDDKVINFIKMFLLEMTEICDQKGIEYLLFLGVKNFFRFGRDFYQNSFIKRIGAVSRGLPSIY